MSSSFSPTPIGKDWTPPQPPQSTYADEEENALGDLFADDSATPAVGGEAATQDGTSALGDLFADTPATEPTTPVDGPAGGGLGALFAETDPAEDHQPGGNDQHQADSPQEPAVVRPRVRKRGLVGVGNVVLPPSTPATERPVEKQRPQDPVTVDSKPLHEEPAAATRPATPEAPASRPARREPAPAAATPAATSPLEASPAETPLVAPRRSPLVEPGNTKPTATAAQRQERREERRHRNDQNNERIWLLADQTLALIGTDSNLQRITQDLELTQDLEVYRRQRAELESALRPRMGGAGIAIGGPGDIEKIIDRVHDELISISVLGELWRDPEVDEILVDRWDIINVERNGRLETTDLSFRDPRHAESTARALALKVSDRAVSRSIPLVTAELPGARITFAFGAVVKGGLSITIRKFKKLLELSDLLRFGSLNEEMVEFLRDAVQARASILVSGGTGTGKTTIINLLSTFIPDDERVITIEDAFELKLANTHVVSLQTKEASSSDDTVAVDLANLLRNTLRMRPDRIIVGEIREGAGAMVMLAAANTGHDGTITTIHANSVDAALNERLPDLVRQARSNRDDLAIQRSIAGAFDLAIQVTRGRAGGRFISEIALIRGIDEDGAITTDAVFTGHESADGFTFERAPLRAETEFTRRLMERGGGRWTR